VLRGELWHLREALAPEELSHLADDLVVRRILAPGDDGLEGRGHGPCWLGITKRAAPDIGTRLRVHAARYHDHITLRSSSNLVGQLFLDVNDVPVFDGYLVRQVQRRSAVAAIQDNGQPNAFWKAGNKNLPQLVIGKHAVLLVIHRHECLILAVHLIAPSIPLLAPMAAVVEKEVVTFLCACHEPL